MTNLSSFPRQCRSLNPRPRLRVRHGARYLRPLKKAFVKITEEQRQALLEEHKALFSLWASIERAYKKWMGTDKIAFEPDKVLDARPSSSTHDPSTRTIFRDKQRGRKTYGELVAEDEEAKRLFEEAKERRLKPEEQELVQQYLVRTNVNAIRAKKNERLAKKEDRPKRKHATYPARW